MELTLGFLPPRSSKPKWKFISCRKQERELICGYDYMLNHLQCEAEIYKHHLEMKAKSHQ